MRVLNQTVKDNYALYNGDSADVLKGLPDSSVDLSVFSPPFANLYTYSNSERDLGNSKNPAEFWQHFGFIISELLRVMKPGRNVCVHVQQIALQKAKDGVIGLYDFRGDTIRNFTDAGLIYHGEVTIDKDPQAQAIRTKSKALLFTQMHKNSLWSRPALADYIIIFRAPGEAEIPVAPDITNDEWIEWARPIWYGIKESDTLNTVEARESDDERHICPLQLGTIERCIRLWSNRGETVLSPFAGIGSEGYKAILLGRKFIGSELKTAYYKAAIKNLASAERERTAGEHGLFSSLEETNAAAFRQA
jgi:DNA modification methylase